MSLNFNPLSLGFPAGIPQQNSLLTGLNSAPAFPGFSNPIASPQPATSGVSDLMIQMMGLITMLMTPLMGQAQGGALGSGIGSGFGTGFGAGSLTGGLTGGLGTNQIGSAGSWGGFNQTQTQESVFVEELRAIVQEVLFASGIIEQEIIEEELIIEEPPPPASPPIEEVEVIEEEEEGGNEPRLLPDGTWADIDGDGRPDPLTLDLNGSGIALTSAEDGVVFDLDGDGDQEQVAWTQARGNNTNAFLALDTGARGIESGRELFGDQFGDANGFERLRQFDGNRDGVIDRNDAIFSRLETWQDINHDGISQENEMKSLAEAGVESISLNYDATIRDDANGNGIQNGSFRRANGTIGDAVNAWLQIA